MQQRCLNMKPGIWIRLSSFFVDRLIASGSMHKDLSVKVELRNDRFQLNYGKANYSFGALHEVFQKAFKKTKLADKNPQELLLLGFGAGSIAWIVRRELRLNGRITGVEKDSEVIDFAKKYFQLEKLSNCEVIEADAYEFMKLEASTYDLIVVDLFEEVDVPQQFCGPEFIRLLAQHLRPKGLIYFNFVADTLERQERYLNFKTQFEAVFGRSTELVLHQDNRILINGPLKVD